ncbi:PfkB family carbohydrate kinase [Nocardia sp. XZ_19_385]|uniref:PfkB family carbohydrate kinase n=1 Tax=Nocardia sp. XZ_19_385 TaxID=2769488 RepID=UPI00188F160C|nr:PfkB family carbohydrate kinase [Nocardia sp. XZ_19_385]
MAEQDVATAVLCGVFTRLGKRSGLNPDRLRTTEVDVAPLLSLPVVRHHAQRTGAPAEEVVLAVVRAAARGLRSTDRLIVDAVLCLGLLRKNPPEGVDLDGLYAPGLSARRESLTAHWALLHEVTRAPRTPPAPAVRTLRAQGEPRALTALSHLLVTTPSGVPADKASENGAAQPGSRHDRGVVIVVGDAVLDHIYRIDHVPPVGSSTPGSFRAHPGGKGLNRAVAAARLGLEVQLVAAVGDDDAGRWIRDYLRSENVGTDLVRVVPRARTPVTAFMITGTGASSAIGCRDERIRPSIQQLGGDAFTDTVAGSDAVLLTFEQPMVVLEQVLTILRELKSPPVVVLHPSPQIETPQYLYRFLGSVDYLIGSPQQLARMLPEVELHAGTDPAQRLRALGVRAVCEIADFGCTVHSEAVSTEITPFPAALQDSPGAHSAFGAALVHRVIAAGRPATEADYRWATAAMVATQSFGDVPGAMPLAGQIDRIVRLAE